MVTIKRRLFISNVLMIVVPVVASVLSLGVCALILDAVTDGRLFDAFRDDDAGRDRRPDPNPQLHDRAVLFVIVVIVLFVVILFATNRFLTRFVFRAIEQPLDKLSDGAREISNGNLDYQIVYERDDEFKAVCDDFNTMSVKLKALIDEVQKNDRNRRELLAGVSHDLRSPLTSIKGFVEGLIDGVAATSEAQQEYLQIIRQKTDDINDLVSKLFLYSKMDMGDYPTNPQRLDVAGEIADFLASSQESYKNRGLLIRADDLSPGCVIDADRVQLRSVVTNVLDNSALYKVKPLGTVAIGCVKADGYVRLSFDDDGPGVAPDDLPRMFDVFYRGDPSRSGLRQGSGLGLAIASKAVARMGGRISAQNLSPSGLRVIVEVPVGAVA